MTPRSVRERFDDLAPARAGVAIYILAGLVFIASDTLTKSLVADAPVVDVVFGRHLSAFVAVLLLTARRSPRRLLHAKRPGIQIFRGIAMFGTTVVFFFALSILPIGTVSALSNTNPLFVLILAGPLLAERVSRTAIAGALIGFAGVLAITGLDVTALDVRLLVPLGFALIYAIFSILSRSLHGEDSDVTVFWSQVVCVIGGTVGVLLIPTAAGPQPIQWLGIALLGLMALTGHWLLVLAYTRAHASDLAPLGYLGVLWSFLVGAAIFHEPILAASAIGAVTIVAGGVIALRSMSGDSEALAAPAIDHGERVDRA